MTDGAASGLVDAFLASLLNDSAFTAFGPVFVQLHVGAPGAAGTSNVAGESLRVSAGSNPAFTGSGGSKTNSNAINWTSVSTAETYTHVSLWSALTAGTFLGSGAITANAVLVGDNFSIPVSDITVSMPVAS